ncbi:MAG TPA: helix-hairpin-helix domain-containing protein [Chitinophagaceae bacterium]
MLNEFVKDYFSFTKKERIAVAVLIFFILAFYLLPFFIRPVKDSPDPAQLERFKKLEAQIAMANRKQNSYHRNEHHYDEEEASQVSYADPPLSEGSADPREQSALRGVDGSHKNSFLNENKALRLFYFDPNTVSEEGWKRLGLRDKTIGTILKYLSRGGHFYSPSDLQKIYGLRPEEYERIAPYIRINISNNTGSIYNSASSNKGSFRESGFPQRNYNGIRKTIDINSADTSEWIDLPGIGSKLANRIVQFREKLGGFHDIIQISETWGLPDSTFQKIKPLLKKGDEQIRKINVNTASLEVFKAHPYIRWEMARAIVGYREQHGHFKTLEELQQIGAIEIKSYNKMLPYLFVE